MEKLMFQSQAGQDRFVLQSLDYKHNGFYLEIGAYNSKEISNTYILEKQYNWSGVSFDIIPEYVDEFNLNRKNYYDISKPLKTTSIVNRVLNDILLNRCTVESHIESHFCLKYLAQNTHWERSRTNRRIANLHLVQ
jgi:hypothetical protein